MAVAAVPTRTYTAEEYLARDVEAEVLPNPCKGRFSRLTTTCILLFWQNLPLRQLNPQNQNK